MGLAATRQMKTVETDNCSRQANRGTLSAPTCNLDERGEYCAQVPQIGAPLRMTAVGLPGLGDDQPTFLFRKCDDLHGMRRRDVKHVDSGREIFGLSRRSNDVCTIERSPAAREVQFRPCFCRFRASAISSKQSLNS